MKKQNTYLAKMVFQIISGAGTHKPQFDEQFRIFEAASEAQALEKARIKGKEEELSFTNEKNELVVWNFIGILDLFELKNIKDGAQIHSCTEEPHNASEFISLVKQKERTIETLSNFAYIF
ncbi:MAG: DUF4288 domain-containing protein [Bacteroidetes bacterium]|nr:DUF4288 domain-containing protein [Bacteroidota bacterium]